MCGFVVLDGSASKCEQIPLSIERQALFEESLPPPQSPPCFELQPYLRYWYYVSTSPFQLDLFHSSIKCTISTMLGFVLSFVDILL